jgi:hypothetical protein
MEVNKDNKTKTPVFHVQEYFQGARNPILYLSKG